MSKSKSSAQSSATSSNDSSAIVELKGVHKTYLLGRTEVSALKGIDLRLERGDFTALVGTSGSGKSTLLNIVGTIDNADKGEVYIDGAATQKMSDNELSQLRNEKIGFVFQNFNLIPVLNVFENVGLPLLIQKNIDAKLRVQKVEQIVRDVGLMDFAHHLPDQLSGGQRQRVAIARALVTEPILILADEPTANLDSKTTHSILDLLLELNQSRKVTFLFCSHDEKLVQRVSRIVRIQDGILQP